MISFLKWVLISGASHLAWGAASDKINEETHGSVDEAKDKIKEYAIDPTVKFVKKEAQELAQTHLDDSNPLKGIVTQSFTPAADTKHKTSASSDSEENPFFNFVGDNKGIMATLTALAAMAFKSNGTLRTLALTAFATTAAYAAYKYLHKTEFNNAADDGTETTPEMQANLTMEETPEPA